jgi:hypothetical protein
VATRTTPPSAGRVGQSLNDGGVPSSRARHTGDDALWQRAVAAWDLIGARFERACTQCRREDIRAVGVAELDALGCPPPAV